MALVEPALAEQFSAIADQPNLVCRHSDPLFLAIKRCLDGGAGACFVLDNDLRLLGRITLDSARAAIRAGELSSGVEAGRSVALLPEHADTTTRASSAAMPILDKDGCLLEVAIDRSRAHASLAQPDMTSREFEALIDAFLSNWISSRGPNVPLLEEGFVRLTGCTEAIAVSSGTAALHLALLSLGIGPGDEVIVPDLTFAATINAVLHCGATPVIADVDSANWGLSPHALKAAVTPRTKAVIIVHLYGRPALEETIAVARAHGLFIVEDCAEAQGARLGGRAVGSIGDVACFSLFGNKLITTGEGGMCTTSIPSLALAMRELRDHGVSATRPFWHERVGYNYRLTNLQAAIGRVQIERFDEIVARRDRVAGLYRDHLACIRGVRFPSPCEPGSRAVNWLTSLTVPADARDALLRAAAAEEIDFRAFFYTLSSMPPYRAFARECPNSQMLSETGLCLPTTGYEDEHLAEKVAKIFRCVLG